MRHCRTLILAWLTIASAVHADVTIEIGANGIARNKAIGSVPLPAECNDWTHVAATSEEGRPILAQVADHSPRRLYVLVDQLAANEVLRINVAPQSNDDGAANVRLVDQDGGFNFFVGERPVLRYNHAMIESPSGLDPIYRRSGHIHPVYSPSGRLITDDFCPTDHTHQHGIMFAWTNCSFENRKVNFWEQKNKQAVVRHRATTSRLAGPVFAELRTIIDHIDTTTGIEKPVISEEWRLRVYNIAERFVFDLRSYQTCVASTPLIINKYHYGGIAIRGHRTWTTENSGFLTSNGKRRVNGNHDRPNWCDMHGSVDGAVAGVTLYCHPDNFRSPQPVRLHPSMPYFCYAPLVLGEFQISPGKPLVSNYRFVTHDENVDADAANKNWMDYAHPMTLAVAE